MDFESAASVGSDVFDGEAGSNFAEGHIASGFIPAEDCHVGNAHIYDLFSSER